MKLSRYAPVKDIYLDMCKESINVFKMKIMVYIAHNALRAGYKFSEQKNIISHKRRCCPKGQGWPVVTHVMILFHRYLLPPLLPAIRESVLRAWLVISFSQSLHLSLGLIFATCSFKGALNGNFFKASPDILQTWPK